MINAVYSYEGRVEVMLFKEELKQCVERINAAINAIVATAQRKPSSVCLHFPIYPSACYSSDLRREGTLK